LSEFTGERVIPGLVDADLLNEHVARYRFARRFAAAGATVLDAGCGSGYGAQEFREAASVIGTDLSADAIRYACENFARPGVRFLEAACERLPFADASFDLVAAFEVIEHLERWQDLLSQAARVLKASGVLLVSTPNKSYYAESRAAAGPNPFHCHEFEFEEFRTALAAVFPHVRMWTQNHTESIIFAPERRFADEPQERAALEATGDPAPQEAHFFLAACSRSPIVRNDVYAWVPSSANLLREREHHITKLEAEIAKKDDWLREMAGNHARLHQAHEETQAELQRQNEWAERLNGELAMAHRGIERLEKHREELEADLAERAAWGRSLDAQLEERSRQLQDASAQLRHFEAERRLIAGSKWIRLGRKLNLGPVVDGE
jgi:ubiquinone/menaquinone biosynthesis C-methylase UbiE